MAELFQKDRTVIGRHINNIYKEHELERETTCANFAHVGKDADQTYQTILYNLDVIISVGYRVKSQRGTQFRIWANKVLKEYLVKGYAVNKTMTEQRYAELKQLVPVLGRTVKPQETLASDDALNLVEVVSDYAYADGTKRIADNTLVALTLMIAESRTEEKDIMVKVVVNLINKNNYE